MEEEIFPDVEKASDKPFSDYNLQESDHLAEKALPSSPTAIHIVVL